MGTAATYVALTGWTPSLSFEAEIRDVAPEGAPAGASVSESVFSGSDVAAESAPGLEAAREATSDSASVSSFSEFCSTSSPKLVSSSI